MSRMERSALAAKVRLQRPSGAALPPALRAFRPLLYRGPEPLQDVARRAAGRFLVDRLPELVARYPDGRRFHVPARDRMYAQVYILGEYEPTVSEVMRLLLRPGDFAVDVGANHGWYAALMGVQVGPGGEVWAIEPLPPLLAELRLNVELNADLKVEVKPLALGAEAGELEVHLFAGLPHGHASASTLGRDDYETHRAEMQTLDSLAGDRCPALVKVDVEGAELEVLRGARMVLGSDAPPILILEVNHETSAAFGYEPGALLDELPDGYKTYRAERGRLVPECDPRAAEHGATWVCVPAARADRARSAL